mmetsp:Transcript_66918/g.217713  ORF Transcript_66918/g.217713 Transcript_66918/m.217713 type:complete len:101 (+) Transcript_66918:858-1160(+)
MGEHLQQLPEQTKAMHLLLMTCCGNYWALAQMGNPEPFEYQAKQNPAKAESSWMLPPCSQESQNGAHSTPCACPVLQPAQHRVHMLSPKMPLRKQGRRGL